MLRLWLPFASLALAISAGASAEASLGGVSVLPQGQALIGPASASAAPITAVQPAQRNSFSLFRSHPEGLPSSARHLLDHRGLGIDAHFNYDLAQRAKPNPFQEPIWAIPGHGWVCIYTQLRSQKYGGGSACARTKSAARIGLDLYVLGAGNSAHSDPGGGSTPGAQTVGIVPDGFEAVRLRRSPDGLPVPVSENAFSGKGQGVLGLIELGGHEVVLGPSPRTVRSSRADRPAPSYTPSGSP